MLKWILLAFLSLNIYALDISLQGAKENFQNYSTLHIKDKDKFLCEEMTNDFKEVVKIVCAFSKSPAKELKTLQNDFFKIETQIKKKTFFLIITPYKKMKLFPVVFDLSKDDSVYKANAKLARHWMLVGYNKELPYIKTQEASDVAINFPFMLDKDKLPYVGSLDMKGNPVHIQEVQDVSDYLKIKRLYAEKNYEKCLELIDEVMLEYPTSLFNAELLYYKIRVNSRLEDKNDDVIELSKVYLREYSSDDNVAEVLSLIARAYYLSGISGQADYFFDRLFSEHEDSPYAKWGYIYKGEMLEESGASSKALEYYKKALHETSDIDIAATAAYRLALYNINSANKEEATKYAMKIIQAKPSFFASKYKKTLEMIETFVDEGELVTASAIAQAVVNEINVEEYDEYESLLKNIGVWLAKTPKKQEALSALNEYLKQFPDGLYDSEVQVAKDSLFFDVSDANLSTKIADYNKLIETYSQDTIGKRAIYEKAKLMYDNGMYSDVLEFKDELLALDATTYPDTQTIVNDAAVGAMETSLKNKECHSVLKISSEYSIKLSDKWDDGIYACAMKGADFSLAKNIASKNLKSENMQMRKKWLYRHIKVDFATGNYSDVVKASEELITLIEGDNKSEYKDVYRVLFDTYNRLENADKMIESLASVQKVFGASYKDIERYIYVMAIGSDRNDDNLVLKYGNEVMKIQKSSNSYAQSPFVEFALYQAYINKEDFNKALEIIKSLDTVELSKGDRSRQKYLLGAIYEKLWRGEEAQVAYQESIDADAASAWAKLAEGAKED
ncbi:tol-pal system YbgF family protein [Sulfurimonas sp.]|uniref:tetratricopeptide repeat protein n=1 Tax=Sulfurimonas sp. TaxID=2022749 RepID=UPI003562A214